MAAPGNKTRSYAESRATASIAGPLPYLVLPFHCEDSAVRPMWASIAEVESVLFGRGDELKIEPTTVKGRPVLRVTLPDEWMSTEHAELRRGPTGWLLCDRGSKNGTYVFGERIEQQQLQDGDWFELGSCFCLYRDALSRPAGEGPTRGIDCSEPTGLQTLSPLVREAWQSAIAVAESDVPVLLAGETGAGKEVVARELHRLSQRSGRFVAVNCAAIPENLIESHLFGHRRGAFSGAVDSQDGVVRAADGGTLLLDEVAELTPSAQAALLRVLQEREVTPVGDSRPVPVDFRVICASHIDLEKRVAEKLFRTDLLARIAGIRIQVPALRDRPEDLPWIIQVLAEQLGGGPVRFERSAARALLTYSWPRNVRELEQALRAALALAGEERRISLKQLPEAVREPPATEDELASELKQLLAKHRGNVSAVARAMGKARVQIRRWCSRFGIDPDDYRS